MSHNIRHMSSHHPASSSSTSLLLQRSILSFLLVLSLVLCSSLAVSSTSLRSSSSSASSSTSPPDVWAPTAPSTTGRTDVWPNDASSGVVDPHAPDMTSALHCESLELDPVLAFNQSVHCTIECKMAATATAGKVSDYEWSAEEVSAANVAAAVQRAGSWASRDTGAGCSTSDVKFGTVTNFTSYNESKVLAFVYTAPSTGSVGILHVLAGPFGEEIENSPIVFSLKKPANSGNSTTPIPPPPDTPTSSSFVSLSNPAFIAVCAVAGVLLVAALLGGMWARRVFARKADEVREHQVSERQWAHSVPSLKARLDAPQPSTLRSPLLR